MSNESAHVASRVEVALAFWQPVWWGAVALIIRQTKKVPKTYPAWCSSVLFAHHARTHIHLTHIVSGLASGHGQWPVSGLNSAWC